MIYELANKIWSREEFWKDYRKLLRIYMSSVTGVTSNMMLDEVTIKRLLQSATVFAATGEANYRESANRIALSLWHLYKDEYYNLSDIIRFILSRMGNFPTVQLFKNTNENISEESALPLRLSYEILDRKEKNLITLPDGDSFVLTDFQIKIWKNLSLGKSLSVSAPTSAGKSFALQRFIATKALENPKYRVVYIVPTRALINQVSSKFVELTTKNRNQNKVEVLTIPLSPSEVVEDRSIIYVLTQERLHSLITEEIVHFDLVVVDESQVISADEKADNNRGVMLQSVIEHLLKGSKEAQIMFASPLTDNPQIFSSLFKIDHVLPIIEDECPVPQNLVLLDLIATRKFKLRSIVGGELIEIGEKRTDVIKSMPDFLTLGTTAWEFGQGDKNIVYTMDAGKCEKIADFLSDRKKAKSTKRDLLLEEFSDFIKEHVHREYKLAEVIKSGVAFHYGNMPATIRKTVEELFDEGRLDYLICTSTLLHGVNLPAKNLFMLKPAKKNTPLSSIEFWNLAGRAGRMGKDFNGNVFMINLEQWKEDPLQGKKKQTVNPSYQYYLREKNEDLLTFMRDPYHASGAHGQMGIENTFVKLFNDYRGGNLDYLDKEFLGNTTDDTKNKILTILQKVSNEITLPQDILDRNINISPYRQQYLYNYFVREIKNESIKGLIPPHPSRPFKEADAALREVLKTIHREFSGTTDNSHDYYSPLALKWMRGESLANLIDSAYKNEFERSEEGASVNIHSIIRKVMRDVEETLRFKYVKFVSCYNDLLAQALMDNGLVQYTEKIPKLPTYLELGASSETMINLISLGITRATSSVLSGNILESMTMTREELERWLSKVDIEKMDVSVICKRELLRVRSSGIK